jgi:hypothetical protein
VAADAADVVAAAFAEAGRRDPHHERTWIALADGNKGHCEHQDSLDRHPGEKVRSADQFPATASSLLNLQPVSSSPSVGRSARHAFSFAGPGSPHRQEC